MKLNEYIRRYDALSFETSLLKIPGRKEYLLREIGRGKKVLDLGCLGGKLSSLIKSQNNEVYGVELNPEAAAQAQSRGIRVKVFDLNDGIPFEDGMFDVVNAGEVLGSIYDTKHLFEECHRVLKARGILLVTTPNLNSLSNRVRVLTGGYLARHGAYPEDHFGEHIRVFNIGKLRELCRHTGFEIENISGTVESARVLKPLLRVVPQLGELLMVRARRIEPV